jgi:hypothetical protein
MPENDLLVPLLRAVILWSTVCTKSLQQECLLSVPLTGPELYYVQREDICSIIVDWSDDIMILSTHRDRCEVDDISGYEVEINFMSSCTNQSLRQNLTGTVYVYDFSTLNPVTVDSECSETSDCYRHRAKIRAQLGNSFWSHYSTWTTVSNTYRTVRGINIIGLLQSNWRYTYSCVNFISMPLIVWHT